MNPQQNIHASVVVLGRTGVLISGPSGSGKTALVFELIRRCRSIGHFARLVADDQVYVEAHHGRLIAHAPATIAGLVEITGIGPIAVEHLESAVIDLVVELAPDAPRYQEAGAVEIAGAPLPRLILPQRQAGQAASAVLHWLAQTT